MQFRSTIRPYIYAASAIERDAAPTLVVPACPPSPSPSPSPLPHKRQSTATPWTPSSLLGHARDALLALYEWQTEHQYLGRYSVDKLMRFDHYCRATSSLRVVAVILLTPLPVVVLVLAFQAVPLADPARGVAHNGSLFVWSTAAHAVLTLALTGPLKQALRVSDAIYSTRTMVMIAVFTAVVNEVLWAIPAITWRFPVPHREVLAGVTWPCVVAISHWLFARRLVTTKTARLKRYLPIAATQFTLFFLFLALALVFTRLTTSLQLVWIVAFPFVKVATKKWLWQYARRLDDISTDVTVCLVELSGSLYQSVCMQHMESLPAALLLTAMDMAQAALEIIMYARHDFLVDGTRTVATAVKIVESSLFPAHTEELVARSSSTVSRASLPTSSSSPPTPPLSSRRLTWHGTLTERTSTPMPTPTKSSRTSTSQETNAQLEARTSASVRPSKRASCPNVYVTKSPNSVFIAPADYETRRNTTSRGRLLNLRRHSVTQSRHATASSSSCAEVGTMRFTGVHALVRQETNVVIDHLSIKRKDQARILEQSLQLLFSSEVLIFVEYIEVIIPLIYTTIATVAWFLPNAKYNTLLCMLSHDKMLTGLAYTVSYALLETVTFAAMCLFMQRTFGVSTLYQLAFVLESYALTIQGKLMGSFIVIVNLAIVHQGVDMTFLTGASTRTGSCQYHGA